MSILERNLLNQAIQRIEQLESEVAALKAEPVAWSALDEPKPRRKPGRPRKQQEAVTS